jgi:vesicle coat complex subunit
VPGLIFLLVLHNPPQFKPEEMWKMQENYENFMTIELSGDWDFEKISSLSGFMINNYGETHDIKLYIDHKSYSDIMTDYKALKTYNNNFAGINDILCVNTFAGKIFVYPTTDYDKLEFSTDTSFYSFKITNKVKDYKKDFEEIVNG